ncbi:MAG: MMPL family transporter, partial [Actinomycetota bacterium]|nr:MMPL family transporter [Actinomycetota bacterium]
VQTLLSTSKQQVDGAAQAAGELALARGLSPRQAAAAASSARTLESAQQQEKLARLYLDSGISGMPRIDDRQFIPQVVFDQTRGVNQPKSRFVYLFPSTEAALIQVRLKSSLTDSQQSQAIQWIRQAVQMPMFRSAYGGRYTITGAPVVAEDLAAQITGSIAGLLLAAVLVMAVTLLVVFRARLRLLPLATALAAAGIAFGVAALAGGTLTMASIAVLPILIGLAVDYAIQFQSRVLEAAVRQHGAVAAVSQAASAAAPTIAVAALATATGFLVLLLSPVPMVRSFGLLLVVGIAVGLACALTSVAAVAVLAEREGGVVSASLRGAAEILGSAGARLKPTVSRRRRLPAPNRAAALQARALRVAVQHPGRLLAIGAVLAFMGWIADTQTSVQSDVTKLVPSSLPALRDLRTLERVTGVSGEIDVLVHSDNVATPKVVSWMLAYENRLQRHYGYLETQGCATSTLCPALSLPDLFSAGAATGGPPNQSQITALLASVPQYFSQAVITPDHRNATLAFGIRLMPLQRQQGVIDYMNSQLHPPPGVSARLTGLPVLAAQANSALSSSSRRLLSLLAALLAVAVVLLAVFGDRRRALVPLVPIALATGWSALILFAIGIPLNPMSATLGTLVIAISTEFSVLLAERFRQERAVGHDLAGALHRTLGSTGAAALASGVTAIAGFGVLVFSPLTMLRDFGLVTLVDLSVSLAGVLLVLPAVLAVAEREQWPRTLGELAPRVAALLPRARRRAPVA